MAASPDHRDYVAIAENYAKRAISDRYCKQHGQLIRLAAKRFQKDLKRSRRKRGAPFVFDEWHAGDVCNFIEKLPHIEGVWETPHLVLHESHVFFLVQLFGFRNHDGSRRYTSALFAVARKNAKSTLAAGILLYCLCCEDEPGAQVISAATTFDQASIIFKVAKAMADKTTPLKEYFGLETWAKSITRDEINASFKALHAKASTQDGLNPSHVGLDEIHAHKTADLLNVLTSAAGARKSPLWLYTTTEGYTNTGPWSEIRHFAKQLLKGVLGDTADHFLVVFYAVDDKDDEFNESAWIKANPLMDVNPNLKDAIRKESIEARQMPSKMAEFKIKRLNRPAASADAWIDLRRWDKCSHDIELDFLKTYPCWGGLDLASNRDLCSLRLVWRVDDIYYTWGRRWVPQDAVNQRTERGTVRYDKWVAGGYLEVTEGDVTDYRIVEQAVLDAYEMFNVQIIAFDRWNAMDLVNRLTEAEIPLIEFVQGPKSYHPAMQELERAYYSGNFVHGGDPVLRWCASNLVARRDVNLNMAPDKRNSAEKIDDMCALLMGIGVSLSEEPAAAPEIFYL